MSVRSPRAFVRHLANFLVGHGLAPTTNAFHDCTRFLQAMLPGLRFHFTVGPGGLFSRDLNDLLQEQVATDRGLRDLVVEDEPLPLAGRGPGPALATALAELDQLLPVDERRLNLYALACHLTEECVQQQQPLTHAEIERLLATTPYLDGPAILEHPEQFRVICDRIWTLLPAKNRRR